MLQSTGSTRQSSLVILKYLLLYQSFILSIALTSRQAEACTWGSEMALLHMCRA